ncbi:hypothetical protein BESB_001700 [Besnoitia besnoiti]|uniref:Protein kinase domain-containing protein n=1 Tax=Besnoitia besnoiti TaxID=94643 RepID=A0A2A9MH24_BESBE|nr:hypothetical protein BESB_001700 [Besnoitia besnoiti]PFH37828.1 hypothetical protein BESB_001700 [Besnoitia besnoiti]
MLTSVDSLWLLLESAFCFCWTSTTRTRRIMAGAAPRAASPSASRSVSRSPLPSPVSASPLPTAAAPSASAAGFSGSSSSRSSRAALVAPSGASVAARRSDLFPRGEESGAEIMEVVSSHASLAHAPGPPDDSFSPPSSLLASAFSSCASSLPSEACFLPACHPTTCTCRLELGSCALCPVPCCCLRDSPVSHVSLLEYPLSHRLRVPLGGRDPEGGEEGDLGASLAFSVSSFQTSAWSAASAASPGGAAEFGLDLASESERKSATLFLPGALLCSPVGESPAGVSSQICPFSCLAPPLPGSGGAGLVASGDVRVPSWRGARRLNRGKLSAKATASRSSFLLQAETEKARAATDASGSSVSPLSTRSPFSPFGRGAGAPLGGRDGAAAQPPKTAFASASLPALHSSSPAATSAFHARASAATADAASQVRGVSPSASFAALGCDPARADASPFSALSPTPSHAAPPPAPPLSTSFCSPVVPPLPLAGGAGAAAGRPGASQGSGGSAGSSSAAVESTGAAAGGETAGSRAATRSSPCLEPLAERATQDVSVASALAQRRLIDVSGTRVLLFEGLYFGRILHRGFSNTVCFCSWKRPIDISQLPLSVSYVNHRHLLLPSQLAGARGGSEDRGELRDRRRPREEEMCVDVDEEVAADAKPRAAKQEACNKRLAAEPEEARIGDMREEDAEMTEARPFSPSPAPRSPRSACAAAEEGEEGARRERGRREKGEGDRVAAKAEAEEDAKRLVVKVTHKDRLTSSVELLRARHEVLLLQELEHPNVLPLLLAGEDEHEMFMFFDFATCGDLYNITKMKAFDEQVVRHICVQILRALRYIHGNGIIHCDIKPHNLLVFRPPSTPAPESPGAPGTPPAEEPLRAVPSPPLATRSLPVDVPCREGRRSASHDDGDAPQVAKDRKAEREEEMEEEESCAESQSAPAAVSVLDCSNGLAKVPDELDKVVIKVCDFGLAQHVKRGQMIRCDELRGSHGYLAPELLQREPYDERIDLWAVGVIVYTMIGGYEPFYPPSECINGELEFDDRYWGCVSAEAKDFIARLLTRNPRNRMTADEALVHPWISGFR